MKSTQSIDYQDNETDPKIKFHEFVLVCGRMAMHSMTQLTTVKERLTYFFTEKLKLTKVTFGKTFLYEEYWQKELELREEDESSDEDIWGEEEESEEEGESEEDEEWVLGEDGVRYPKKFGVYEDDVIELFDELEFLPALPDAPHTE